VLRAYLDIFIVAYLNNILHRREGTGGMELDPQLILEDEAYDEAALSSAMCVSESRGTM
jgi:hypothetical protein